MLAKFSLIPLQDILDRLIVNEENIFIPSPR